MIRELLDSLIETTFRGLDLAFFLKFFDRLVHICFCDSRDLRNFASLVRLGKCS